MESIKEVLKKVLSDDFIKECAEDFTKDGIEQLTGTMLGAVTKTFFEKWNYCRALTQAEKEGTGANQKQLKEFIENWKSDSSVYSEDELNDMFERTYQELQKNSENFKEVDKEELCKQYKKFVTEYMKSLMSEVTTGEKIVIQKVDGIRENIKEVSDNTQEANRILQDMNKNADVPIIDFVKNIVKVKHYDYKYIGLYNTFDYVEDTYEEDADTSKEEVMEVIKKQKEEYVNDINQKLESRTESSGGVREIGSVTSGGSSSGGSSSTSESSSSNSDYEHLQAHEGSGIDWSKYNTGDGGFNFR
jgi:uncharacterized protein YukE